VPFESVILTDSAGARVAVIGPLKRMAASLAGAEVGASGTVGAAGAVGAPRAIMVDQLDVVSVRGLPASLGVLRHDGDAYVLDGRERWGLTDVPPDLAERVNRTVWVAGEHRGGTIQIVLWGEVAGGAEAGP
jgi:hypothetical protein